MRKCLRFVRGAPFRFQVADLRFPLKSPKSGPRNPSVYLGGSSLLELVPVFGNLKGKPKKESQKRHTHFEYSAGYSFAGLEPHGQLCWLQGPFEGARICWFSLFTGSVLK